MKRQKTKKITPDILAHHIELHMKYTLCKRMQEATKEHLFTALALSVRDLCIDQMFDTAARHSKKDPKRIYYLSMEYLIGRLLENNLHNFGIYDMLDKVKLDNPIPLREVLDAEYDMESNKGCYYLTGVLACREMIAREQEVNLFGSEQNYGRTNSERRTN